MISHNLGFLGGNKNLFVEAIRDKELRDLEGMKDRKAKKYELK